jgi:DNA helicase-2/ATP-dependent DNA helicase PcrA
MISTSRLSGEQRAAAEAGPEGAFLIAAGPGTGKTLTAVERFCWLAGQGVPVANVLAVTFTERAAAELRERVSAELQGRGHRDEAALIDEAWIGTFHGVCARLLRDNAYTVGVDREVKVLDEVGQRLLVERLAARLRSGADGELDPDDFKALNPDEVSSLLRDGLRFAQRLKGRGIGPDGFRARALELHGENHRHGPGELSAEAEREAISILHTVYASYEAALQEAGVMDFDDLILAVTRALAGDEDFAARCRSQFRYILVDEFQDTNRIQLELIRLLAAPGFANVAVVGDAKQSIYGWRDAEIENIRTRFPGRRLPLTRNRRSYQEILDVATAFIRRDPEFGDEPELVAERGPSAQAPPVRIVMAADSAREARLVAAEIRRLVKSGRDYSDIAVLAHSVTHLPREFEEELRRHGIPYLTSGGSGFFDRQEIKDVLGLLRLTADPMDDAALVRVLQGPVVRVGDPALYRLARRRHERYGMRLRDCVEESRAEGFPELEAAVAQRLTRVIGVTDRLAATRDALTVADTLNRLLEETGYLRHAQLRAVEEGPRGLLNLRKVFRMANRFERDSALAGIGDFVRHLDQIMGAEVPIGEAEAEAQNAVSLLTIHSSKGLEFPVVFLVNLRPPQPRDWERLFFDPDGFGFVMRNWEKGKFGKHPRFDETAPSAAAVKLAREERRRAVYVALTRAEDLLYVSATREEASPLDVVAERADDHYAELVEWARANPDAASVIEAEQLELPQLLPAAAGRDAGARVVTEVLERLELLQRPSPAPPAGLEAIELSFSQLHAFELCPVRYRFDQVWRVPAPPDELLAEPARSATGGSRLGAAVHAALAAPEQVLERFRELAALSGLDPADGEAMLQGWLRHPLSAAPTLGTEVEFNLRLGGVRVKGVVDRICELDGDTVVVDYKTNSHLDARLREAYSTQLRLYGLAAREGLLLGARNPRLVLFDLRRGEAIEVSPDPEAAADRVRHAAAAIAAGRFELGPEHDDRPCRLCAYRPVCADRRA